MKFDVSCCLKVFLVCQFFPLLDFDPKWFGNVWNVCQEFVAMWGCVYFHLGRSGGCFAQTNKKLPKLNTTCWAKKQTFRKRLVGWLVGWLVACLVGWLVGWLVASVYRAYDELMSDVQHLFNLSGGENKGSSHSFFRHLGELCEHMQTRNWASQYMSCW